MILLSACACAGLAHVMMFVGRHVPTASVCDVSEGSCGDGEKSEYVRGNTLWMCCVVGDGDAEDCCTVVVCMVCCVMSEGICVAVGACLQH